MWACALSAVAFGLKRVYDFHHQRAAERAEQRAIRAVMVAHMQFESDQEFIRREEEKKKIEAEIMVCCGVVVVLVLLLLLVLVLVLVLVAVVWWSWG
jgi:hypothetical protein